MKPAVASRLNADQHGIVRERIDSDVLDLIDRLIEAGFEAYLVGGCIRDLMLGMQPKDFDVATSATPEAIKDLFRRSRMIGRRFKIAHVRYGRKVFEVTTFRKLHDVSDDEDRHEDTDGMILRDNVYGTFEEDAFRRDFTVNALYYDVETEEVIDFVDGLKDMRNRTLRLIGEPVQRLQEDPVRLLRAIRFQAKLGFDLDPPIVAATEAAAERLSAIAPARLFDETQKMLLSGYAGAVWQLIENTPIRAALFPTTPPNTLLVTNAMRNTDARIAQDKPVTPGFLLAVMLWDDYCARVSEYGEARNLAQARSDASFDALAQLREIMSIPRRFSQFAREVWMLQPHLEARQKRRLSRLVAHPRFRAAYDFLVLRGECDESLAEPAKWWTDYQANDGQANDGQADDGQADDGQANDGQVPELPISASSGAPKRRRRRRKKTES
ncbi:MAG: polynucleotide adenylyltransferase PcnB [Proteobacteria bacterium]|nr:polynucleotide adenylyltransferase PcnB [Pseudomonadota bacterium]